MVGNPLFVRSEIGYRNKEKNMNDNTLNKLNKLQNILDENTGIYTGLPPIIDTPKSKCRFGTTKKKRDKEKELKKKKIADKSRKINRRK